MRRSADGDSRAGDRADVVPQSRSRRFRIIERNPAARRVRGRLGVGGGTAVSTVGVSLRLPRRASTAAEEKREEHDEEDKHEVQQSQDVDSADLPRIRHEPEDIGQWEAAGRSPL